MTVSPSEFDILSALRTFLLANLPANVAVIRGQDNLVPEPAQANFVVMTPIRYDRIETNTDTDADCAFTASIAGQTLNVTAVAFGSLIVGNTLFGTGLASGTATIASQISGSVGGTGVYQLNGTTQTVSSSSMACGAIGYLQPVDVTVQLDVHGPNSQDNSVVISTLFRDDYAVRFFHGLPPPQNSVYPLYADDPRQVPFLNENQQIETRWVIEAHLQANQSVNVPQQFAGSMQIGLISVDATYPP